MRIATVIGNRPQFVKAAAVSRRLREHHEEVLVHTGQHYDDELSRVFFEELGVPAPGRELGVGVRHEHRPDRAHAGRARARARDARPDLVLVYGDTNSTLAGALAAAQARRAGRARRGGHALVRPRHARGAQPRADRPRERPAVLLDRDRRGEPRARVAWPGAIHLVGDVMADVSLRVRADRARALHARSTSSAWSPASTCWSPRTARATSTTRRGSSELVELLEALPERTSCSRSTRARARGSRRPGCCARLERRRGSRLTPPLGYLDFLQLARNARAVLTDSGGVQKEAYLLGTPCMTLRDTTEWVETVEAGWNVLVDLDRGRRAERARAPRPGGRATRPLRRRAGRRAHSRRARFAYTPRP